MKRSPESTSHRSGVKLIRLGVVLAAIAILTVLSFVFMPPGQPDRRAQRAAGLLTGHTEDPSPLAGLALNVDGVHIRRLERLAVVTFTFDVFDEHQELRPDARVRLEQLAAGLRRVANQIALDVAGYAPENTQPGEAYAIGLARATGVARCIVEVAGIPPAAVAARSLGAGVLHGSAERPHAVVIAIAPLNEVTQQLATLRDAGL